MKDIRDNKNIHMQCIIINNDDITSNYNLPTKRNQMVRNVSKVITKIIIIILNKKIDNKSKRRNTKKIPKTYK